MTPTLVEIARALRGQVAGRQVLAPGPGHSAHDRSLAVRPCEDAPDGILVHSYAGDDWRACRDHVAAALGLPADRWRNVTLPEPPEVARWSEARRRDEANERAREQQRLAREAEARIRAERVRRIWDEAEPDPRGTLVERYLNQHRGLDLPPDVCGHALRFHPAELWEGERVPMMVAALRDIHTDAVVGLHRTRLDPMTAQKVGRKMLGRAAGAAIKLTADPEVMMGLHLAEGIETAIAGLAIGLTPMWAMGSVGSIAAFPIVSGIECLTICAETGAASAAAVEQVGTRWSEAGREVFVVSPKTGADLNDATREAVAWA